MQRTKAFSFLAKFLTIALALALGACASGPPKADKARMTLKAEAQINPDATGRPSPVVVRVYQLKTEDKFAAADFFALFDDDQKALGADLLGREEAELTPGESREMQFAVSRDAKFVGVMAAFRDIRNSRWRVVQAAPKKGWLDVFGKDALTITVSRDAVTLVVKD